MFSSLSPQAYIPSNLSAIIAFLSACYISGILVEAMRNLMNQTNFFRGFLEETAVILAPERESSAHKR